MGTDQAWEKWGSQNPYFGVITDEKYRNENISAASKEEFLTRNFTSVIKMGY